MPLNILGKKSWNVWDKKNQERVRRDELKEAEEADKLAKLQRDGQLAKLREAQHVPVNPQGQQTTHETESTSRKRNAEQECLGHRFKKKPWYDGVKQDNPPLSKRNKIAKDVADPLVLMQDYLHQTQTALQGRRDSIDSTEPEAREKRQRKSKKKKKKSNKKKDKKSKTKK